MSQLIKNLLKEHLGPISRLDEELETRVIKAIIRAKVASMRQVREELVKDGINITDRQLRPYKGALITARMGGRGEDVEFIRTRARANYYPGAEIL